MLKFTFVGLFFFGTLNSVAVGQTQLDAGIYHDIGKNFCSLRVIQKSSGDYEVINTGSPDPARLCGWKGDLDEHNFTLKNCTEGMCRSPYDRWSAEIISKNIFKLSFEYSNAGVYELSSVCQ